MFEFDRTIFNPLKNKLNFFKTEELLKNLILKFKNSNNFEISDISSLNQIKENSILFLDKKNSKKFSSNSNLLIITDDDKIYNDPNLFNVIYVKDIDLSYILISNYLFLHEDNIEFKDEFFLKNNSYISKFSSIHNSTKIYNNCVIGRGVRIGKNCIIKNNVVIKNSIIHDNVIIGDNSSIGSSGFGFNLKKLGASSIFPQIGIVIIDNNVRIGSNCTIDRAKIDYTYIGKNSMLDNLIHIAHNVEISGNACIAAQSGISGSTKIGNNLIAGGQSGFSGHIKIGNNVIVAAKSGVTKNLKDNSAVAGFPATDIKEWKKSIIKQRKDGY